MAPSTASTSFYELEFLHSATRVVVALRLWEHERGELPPSLESLVPSLLDEVPRDPYDCAPLRYSRDRRIIYSVGRDLEDEGGIDLEAPRRVGTDEADPTCRVPF